MNHRHLHGPDAATGRVRCEPGLRSKSLTLRLKVRCRLRISSCPGQRHSREGHARARNCFLFLLHSCAWRHGPLAQQRKNFQCGSSRVSCVSLARGQVCNGALLILSLLSVPTCSSLASTASMDAAAMRQCLINAGSPGMQTYGLWCLQTMLCCAWMSRSRSAKLPSLYDKHSKQALPQVINWVPDKALGIQTMLHAMLQRSSSKFRLPATPPRTLCKYPENTILGRCLLHVVRESVRSKKRPNSAPTVGWEERKDNEAVGDVCIPTMRNAAKVAHIRQRSSDACLFHILNLVPLYVPHVVLNGLVWS